MTVRDGFKAKYFLDGRYSLLRAGDLRTPITLANVIKEPIPNSTEHINRLQRYKNDWAKVILGRVEVENGQNTNMEDAHIFLTRVDPNSIPNKSDIVIVDNYLFLVIYARIPARRSKGELENLNFLEIGTKQIMNLSNFDFSVDDSLLDAIRNDPEEKEFKSGEFPLFIN